MTNDPSRPIGALLVPIRSVVRACRRVAIRVRSGGRVRLRRDTVVGAKAVILAPSSFLVGDEVFIGREFHCETDAEIGDGVLISSRVAFVGNDHEFDGIDVPITQGRRLPPSRVVIEGDNLLGFGVTVVGSVTIGRGCIVGAGSLVTRDLPPYTVCVGRPAVVVRQRRRASTVDSGSTGQ